MPDPRVVVSPRKTRSAAGRVAGPAPVPEVNVRASTSIRSPSLHTPTDRSPDTEQHPFEDESNRTVMEGRAETTDAGTTTREVDPTTTDTSGVVQTRPLGAPLSTRNEEQNLRGSSRRSSASAIARKKRQAERAAEEELAKIEEEFAQKEKERRMQAAKRKLQSELDEIASNESDGGSDDLVSVDRSRGRTEEWVKRHSQPTPEGATTRRERPRDTTPESRRATPAPPHGAPGNDYAPRGYADRSRETMRASSSKHHHCCTSSKLPDFKGNYNDWLSFNAAYMESKDSFNAQENLARLRKCLQGEAKEAVSSQLLIGGDATKIMRLLERKYGRSHIIVATVLKKMRALPELSDVPIEINDFAVAVQNTVDTLRVLKENSYLHNEELVEEVKSKMERVMDAYLRYAETADEATPALTKVADFLITYADLVSREWKEKERRAILAATGGGRPRQTGGPSQKAQAKASQPKRITVNATSDERSAVCAHCSSTEHAISSCKRFKNLNEEQRYHAVTSAGLCFNCLKPSHRANRCNNKSRCGKDGCKRRHHALLHREPPYGGAAKSEPAQEHSEQVTCVGDRHTQMLRPVIPVTVYGPRGSARTFALIDPCSTSTLVEESLADQVGADGPTRRVTIIEATKDAVHSMKTISLDIAGPTGTRFHLEGVRTLRNLQKAPQTEPDVANVPHLVDVPRYTRKRVKPGLILGLPHRELFAYPTEFRRGNKTMPDAMLTELGWVLSGPVDGICEAQRAAGSSAEKIFVNCAATRYDCSELDVLIKNNYELEALGVSNQRRVPPDETRAVEILESTCRRVNEEPRWEAGLLWRDDVTAMPPSRHSASKRLHTLERKMDRERTFGDAYNAQMENLIDKGYATLAEPSTSKRLWYLPHFAVTNPNKPGKIRVVFDAAARVDGRSLNDALLTGPDLLASLLGVLFRFRQGSVAVTADVQEMFLRIRMIKADRPAQRFLWRGWDRDRPPKEYEMASLIFGAASSPTTAIYVRDKNADEYSHRYPDAVQAIKTNFYMDDFLYSVDSTERAATIAAQVEEICAGGGFKLVGWSSNENGVLRNLENVPEAPEERSLDLQSGKQEKTLGLRWNPNDDTLGFNLSMARADPAVVSGERRPTKREMLQVVMSVFDPLGILTPIVIQAKTLLQKVWRSGIGWDDPLGDGEAVGWAEWLQRLQRSWTCRVPRCYFYSATRGELQLHTFTDASEDAYAAAAYLRYETSCGEIYTSLVAGKSRVTPLKPVSIPRLELQAALLGARLAATIVAEHTIKVDKRVFWTDSRTVLSWITSEPKVFKTFVAHRLGELDEITSRNEWRWVPTAENVADDATRALPELTPEHRWFVGPGFLRHPESGWPAQPVITVVQHEEMKNVAEAVNTTSERDDTSSSSSSSSSSQPEVTRFSRWTRLVRATAYVLLFVEKCRKQRAGGLQRELMDKAEYMLLKRSQNDAYKEEIKCLKNDAPMPSGSTLQHLSPYIDSEGVLRLRGRASATPGVPRAASEPIILCGRHPMTRLLVQHHHVEAHHANPEAVVNHLRQRYWVVHLRPTVRAVARACQPCRLRRATMMAPPMGDLPAARLGHHHRAFTYCGLDYFGPMDVTVGRRREKRYGALFTCLVTRAVHIEVAASLTTDSAISALRRMMARRGPPAEIHSDNGTNFRGAATELSRAWAELDQQRIKDYVLNRGARWLFIPPGAPFMGGAWERMVASFKKALGVTLHERAPSDEVLATLLAEAEFTINSRPLTHVSVDPSDPEALTPNHLLLGSSAGRPTPGVFDDADLSRRRAWRAAQRLADVFWERWLQEFRPQLLPRKMKSDERPSLREGDVVVIADHMLPRNVWPKGVVARVHPGRDGHVRVADVRTTAGVLRRPARKIIRLPTERVE